MSERRIECRDCRKEGVFKVPDCPQVKDEVWAKIAGPHVLLCLDHAEALLGREIVPDDLAECPANTYAFKLAERGTNRP